MMASCSNRPPMTDPATPAWAAGWTPQTESLQTRIAAHPVAGLAALLDRDAGVADPGQPLPALWHWVALSQWPRARAIGPDGHPRTGGLLPTTPYPRRMWVGSRVEVHEAPTIGQAVTAERRLESLVEKSGRQGSFALVTVRLSISATDGRPLLTEHTQLAYRAPAPTTAADAASTPDHEPTPWLTRQADWDWRFAPDSVMLMMFSALTANAHRIHYDVPYARDVEGYPGLLVHGPLMAMMLGEVARSERPEREIASIGVRALRPMYLTDPASIRRTATTADGAGIDLELAQIDGAANMSATVMFR
jgi:3-methylfumaryl-CoA hydratase